MTNPETLAELLQNLTGQPAPFPNAELHNACELLDNGETGLGWSQFNEVMLLLGYDPMPDSFFQFLVDGETDYRKGATIKSLNELKKSVSKFQEMALLIYGNIKFAFKTFLNDPELLESYILEMQPIDREEFISRHEPVLKIRNIPPEDTYLLGYLVERELKGRLGKNPGDEEALELKRSREETVKDGIFNQKAYLCSDHLDVYVATSMRKRHEYLLVNRIGKKIFDDESLREMKLRWFDPTQAYCPERIDKGLAEALMLKRAKCTIYLAQESETLGKDSELASTLAQGKPVIAYIPEGTPEDIDLLLKDLRKVYPRRSDIEIMLDQLKVFSPGLAWESDEVHGWLADPSSADQLRVRQLLNNEVKRTYDRSEDTLKERHPLGIQVNLDSGVANGVLVVRKIADCAELVRRILLRKMEFEVDYKDLDGNRYILLREKISGCIFRVVTGDEMLTNVFWNYYLNSGT